MLNRYDNNRVWSESIRRCYLDSEYGGKDDVDEECESTCSEGAGGLLGGRSHGRGRAAMLGVTGRDGLGVFA